jgi:predicted metal-dependent hydrolase
VSKHKNTRQFLAVDGVDIQVVRKDIKNLHFVVRPPDGEVCISVPYLIDDHQLRSAVLSRLAWIQKQQKAIAALPRRPLLNYLNGEPHYVFGECFYLHVTKTTGKATINLADNHQIHLHVKQDASFTAKEKLFNEWYRAALKQRIPHIIAKWEPVLGRQVAEWGVKNMKTRWGSCNINRRRIWLSLALAKKPEACLEYVVVHEMAHLIERYHNQRFHRLMDTFIPDWRDIKKILES